MKKIILFFVFSISTLGQLYSQVITDQVIDSLRQIITHEKNDTIKVNLLASFSYHILYTDPKEAQQFAQEGLLLAKSINYKRGEAWCEIGIAYTNWMNGDFTEAINIFLKRHEEAKHKADTLLLTRTYDGIISSYRDQGNHKEALRYALEMLYTLDQNPDSKIYVGSVYNNMKISDSALFYFLPINKTFGRSFYGYTLSEIGKAYHQKNNFSKALYYYQTSIDTLVKSRNIKDLSHAYLGTARLFAEKGILDSCIHYANRGLEISQKLSYKKGAYESYLVLSEAYEPNDKTEALRNYKLAMEVKDEIFNTIKDTRLLSARFNNQLEQIVLEKERDAFQGKLRTNILSGSLFTLFVIAFFLYRNNRLKQKSKRKIEKAYHKLQTTQNQLIQSEKMASLGELTAGIAHEIQNPLNFVNNFSEVSRELMEEMKEELDQGTIKEAMALGKDIENNLDKITHHGKRASDIVQSMLQHSRTNNGKRELTDLNLLADEYLRLAYHGLRAKDKSFNADFETRFDDKLPKVEIVPQDIGRVLLNLINNAFQACIERGRKDPEKTNEDYKPLVIVSSKKKTKAIEISITDNGNGIPDLIKEKIFQPFFTTKPTGQGTGLGLSLSYDIVKAHGGELLVETKEGVGTTLTIQLPIIISTYP